MVLSLICETFIFEGSKRCIHHENASDRVRDEPLVQSVSEIGVDGADIKIIRNMYWELSASVQIMNVYSDEIRIQQGVRQGCVAFPTVFNLFTETIFRQIINMKGVNIEGQITTIIAMLMTPLY